MVGPEETTMFHRDLHPDGRPVSPEERELLLKKVLPSAPSSEKSSPSTSPKPAARKRTLWARFITQIHFILFMIIQAVFSLYLRSRYLYHVIIDRIYALAYHHHRTPEYIQRDVKGLSQLPRHLSVILDLDGYDHDYDQDHSPNRTYHKTKNKDDDHGNDGGAFERLLHDVCEICAWTACAGIPVLTVYERTGILKESLSGTHSAITEALRAYYGPAAPSISLRAPHLQSISPPPEPQPSSSISTTTTTTAADAGAGAGAGRLEVTLISQEDGRATLVDLTKTFAEMAQARKLGPEHVTGELIDQELRDLTFAEPDLLVLFGPRVRLHGFPPWQLRLTEIL
ncbi:MAG: hypothetical protein M1822_000300 [Bathelium mastoideum]|nr:MAG: hypothetical protein M1822_000300 [Bathelium mastoideum]